MAVPATVRTLSALSSRIITANGVKWSNSNPSSHNTIGAAGGS